MCFATCPVCFFPRPYYRSFETNLCPVINCKRDVDSKPCVNRAFIAIVCDVVAFHKIHRVESNTYFFYSLMAGAAVRERRAAAARRLEGRPEPYAMVSGHASVARPPSSDVRARRTAFAQEQARVLNMRPSTPPSGIYTRPILDTSGGAHALSVLKARPPSPPRRADTVGLGGGGVAGTEGTGLAALSIPRHGGGSFGPPPPVPPRDTLPVVFMGPPAPPPRMIAPDDLTAPGGMSGAPVMNTVGGIDTGDLMASIRSGGGVVLRRVADRDVTNLQTPVQQSLPDLIAKAIDARRHAIMGRK